MDTSDAKRHNIILDTDQTDLITCILLDQLVAINRTEEEINTMYDAYAEFLQIVKSGQSPRGSRFLTEMKSLREVFKNESHYVTIIDTIIALWNS